MRYSIVDWGVNIAHRLLRATGAYQDTEGSKKERLSLLFVANP